MCRVQKFSSVTVFASCVNVKRQSSLFKSSTVALWLETLHIIMPYHVKFVRIVASHVKKICFPPPAGGAIGECEYAHVSLELLIII